ncbi:hypothetical protein FFT09_22680 [Saccharomonospora piscinae]|uniref:hypothetical protein n=1 Tax=Saccharomonospora piscinae TaxID=687388 RepID=UPI0011067810|nr:hypothetical protein [Saccharomonospora piscinae]TLW89236.1 hypothetical protein FFT09_22680 [Saccharomonospora piscinae]
MSMEVDLKGLLEAVNSNCERAHAFARKAQEAHTDAISQKDETNRRWALETRDTCLQLGNLHANIAQALASLSPAAK